MVALLILAITAILSLHAVFQAGRTARGAREVQEAEILLQHLIAFGPRTFTDIEGATGSFRWLVHTEITGAERPIAVCRRFVEVAAAGAARRYSAATLETCPEDGAP